MEDATLPFKCFPGQVVRRASTDLVITIHQALGSLTKHIPEHQLAAEQPELLGKEADIVCGRLQRGRTHDLGLEGRQDSNYIESN